VLRILIVHFFFSEGSHAVTAVELESNNLNVTGSQLKHFLADVGNPCQDMILRCHFEGRWELKAVIRVRSLFFKIKINMKKEIILIKNLEI